MIGADVHEVYTVELEGIDLPSVVVMLRAQEPDRYLPIYISSAQGESIAVHLRGQQQERPRTYGLMAELIEKLGGKVEAVHISALHDQVFHALLCVSANGVTHEIDCRPSDALALAVQINAPIFVAPDLLQEPGTPEAIMMRRVLMDFKPKSIKPFELN